MGLKRWWAERKAKKEASKRLKALSLRSQIFGDMVDGPTPTGVYNTVKDELEDVIEQKRKAKEAAQRISSSLKDKEPL